MANPIYIYNRKSTKIQEIKKENNNKIMIIRTKCIGLLDEKPGFEPEVRHQNKIRKVFLRRFPLSRFLAETLRVNKIAMKSFSNLSFGVDFKL